MKSGKNLQSLSFSHFTFSHFFLECRFYFFEGIHMQPGYYWAKHKERGWIVVEVVAGLHGAVLWRGCSVQREEFSEIDEAPIVRRLVQVELQSATVESCSGGIFCPMLITLADPSTLPIVGMGNTSAALAALPGAQYDRESKSLLVSLC